MRREEEKDKVDRSSKELHSPEERPKGGEKKRKKERMDEEMVDGFF